MATLTIKNLPDELYAQLKARAAEHRRSINSEAILAVERALAGEGPRDPKPILRMLREGRATIKGVYLTEESIRAARRGGRA